MMNTYTLPADDLNEAFLSMLRKSYSGKKVEVTVTEINEMDETEYLLATKANREHLLRALKDVEAGKNLIELDITNFQ